MGMKEFFLSSCVLTTKYSLAKIVSNCMKEGKFLEGDVITLCEGAK